MEQMGNKIKHIYRWSGIGTVPLPFRIILPEGSVRVYDRVPETAFDDCISDIAGDHNQRKRGSASAMY